MPSANKERVFLGLGTNVGNRELTLVNAVSLLSQKIGEILAVSPIYSTLPLNPPELESSSQPDFLNLCVSLDCLLQPSELLDTVLGIEKSLGRDRSKEIKWGPRSIDIDILLFGDTKINSERLTVPHAGLTERDFVLIPLADIAGQVKDPISQNTITELLEDYIERGKPNFVKNVVFKSYSDLKNYCNQ